MDIHDSTPPSWLDLESIIALARAKYQNNEQPTAEDITGLSADTLKRRFPEYVKHLSDRRRGMKLRDALTIAEGID